MNIKKKLFVPVNFSGTLRRHENDKFGAIRKTKDKLRKHAGVDLYDDKGNPVKAVLEGIVIRANWNHIYGYLVIIDHTPIQLLSKKPSEKQYTYTLYAHLDNTSVTYGQKIERGKKIATVGNSGNAKGMKPHLHFEVIISKGPLEWHKKANTGIEPGLNRVDPLPYLKGRSIDLGEGEEENPYAELLRLNPLATRYDFMKFATDNNIPRR
jgi:murein DD-endopeptidase MepM/ murein hydrolase activator NlpD